MDGLYAQFHAILAKISDKVGDILNTVLKAIIQKDPEQLDDLMDKKKGPYTELDFFVQKMIKLNTYTPTTPYRDKLINCPRTGTSTLSQSRKSPFNQ